MVVAAEETEEIKQLGVHLKWRGVPRGRRRGVVSMERFRPATWHDESGWGCVGWFPACNPLGLRQYPFPLPRFVHYIKGRGWEKQHLLHFCSLSCSATLLLSRLCSTPVLFAPSPLIVDQTQLLQVNSILLFVFLFLIFCILLWNIYFKTFAQNFKLLKFPFSFHGHPWPWSATLIANNGSFPLLNGGGSSNDGVTDSE